MDITDTQQAILDLIRTRLASEGMPPSQSEIAQAFGFSGVRAAQYHLEALEQAGAIQRVPGKARGIRLVQAPSRRDRRGCWRERDQQRPMMPCACRCSAGSPPARRSGRSDGSLGSDDYVLLDRVFFSPAPDYLLKVKGDSMRDEGIFDGDLIGVHRTRDARSGQIVVARLDEEITVKLLKIGQDRIRLLPRNPDYAPIEVLPDQDFAIEGLYCGLVRPNR